MVECALPPMRRETLLPPGRWFSCGRVGFRPHENPPGTLTCWPCERSSLSLSLSRSLSPRAFHSSSPSSRADRRPGGRCCSPDGKTRRPRSLPSRARTVAPSVRSIDTREPKKGLGRAHANYSGLVFRTRRGRRERRYPVIIITENQRAPVAKKARQLIIRRRATYANSGEKRRRIRNESFRTNWRCI